MSARPGADPQEEVIAGLRRQLQRAATYEATGEIEIHITHGTCIYIKPVRIPFDDKRIDYNTLNADQQAVLTQVVILLLSAAKEHASGQIWVRLEQGVPSYPVEHQFLEYMKAPKQLSRAS